MRNIVVEKLNSLPVEEHGVELVERKGVGHPDSICDAIMDQISINLSQEYIKRVGNILHHNIDKSLLVAGEVERNLGVGGKVKKPMLLVIGDRATFDVDGIRIPVEEIAIETAKEWLRKNLRFVDPDKHIKFQVELYPGSPELTDIFKRRQGVLPANDTSAAVGYAPLTSTEKIVIELERYLNSPEFKATNPEVGEDIKIMASRQKRHLQLTVAVPLVDRYINSVKDYFEKKEMLRKEMEKFVQERAQNFESIVIDINTLDDPERGMDGIYITVLGTSAEDADSGQVGRGNRVNGVIALNRPMGTEAAAGKNPVSHVGKIYNILTHKVANEIYKNIPGIREVYVWLCSQIGKPIDQPRIATAQLILEDGVSIYDVAKPVEDVIDQELANIEKFCDELAEGKYSVW
ncbi:MAG TPA: methionine adenosyltransferase [Dictyoglomaceae bacterium]|nr:methionine adenosyltransferase [Dictyoglomaceae bacterium]HOL39529.1 methionine adenosyltransferase [Dictyoglomaceae bacterium]HOP94678.1 methionine adenosyltransferase [Dictyoglomaceae bacterium]HPP16092.1 methionine adenosyltransferase [Dictyoglomaceae bacterium]HPU43027.1 methionine adenosyltransferase [Dictyoglomaceae bacterium]